MDAAHVEHLKILWRLARIEENSSIRNPDRTKKRSTPLHPSLKRFFESVEKGSKITASAVRNIVKEKDEENRETRKPSSSGMRPCRVRMPVFWLH